MASAGGALFAAQKKKQLLQTQQPQRLGNSPSPTGELNPSSSDPSGGGGSNLHQRRRSHTPHRGYPMTSGKSMESVCDSDIGYSDEEDDEGDNSDNRHHRDDDEDLNTDKDIKHMCMPFFKRFWNLGRRKKGKKYSDENFIGAELYGRPVEEVDPFVFEDTFCVVSRKYNKHYIFRFSSSKSLFLFGPMSVVRKLAIRIMTNQFFDLFIIATILINCVLLALDKNEEIVGRDEETGEEMGTGAMDDNEPPENIYFEYAFLLIYSLELLIKVTSKGFVFNKFSYLRNAWNILDFTCLLAAYATVLTAVDKDKDHTNSLERNKSIFEEYDLEVLRTFRVLRAIKTISILPGLRMMINALLSSVVQLLEVMALTVFCLCIFALFALEVYMGKLRQKCVAIKGGPYANESEPIEPGQEDTDKHWIQWILDNNNWLQRNFPTEEYAICGNESFARPCPAGYTCIGQIGENPDYGWTSFDSFFQSMLTTFQLITLDYWERIYDLVLSTTGPLTILFFMMVVFLGSFYLLNLMLAVVAMSYEAEAHNINHGPLTKHQKLSLYRSASTFSFDDPIKLNITLMTQYRKRTPEEREMIARSLRNASLGYRKQQRRAIRRKTTRDSAGGTGGETGGLGTGGETGSNTGVCTPIGTGEINSIDGSVCEGENTPRPGSGSDNFRNKTLIVHQKNASSNKSVISTMAKSVKSVSDHRSGGHRSRHGKSGGKRVSARVVKSVDTDGKHFYLETSEGDKAQQTFTDTILGLLGKKMSIGGDGDGEAILEHRKYDDENPPPSPPNPPNASLNSKASSVVSIDDGGNGSSMSSGHMTPPVPKIDGKRFSFGSSMSLGPVTSKSNQDIHTNEGVLFGNAGQTAKFTHGNPFNYYIAYIKIKFHQAKNVLRPLVDNMLFEGFITICIIFNTVLLACEHHLQPPWLDHLLKVGNHFFTVIFISELILKLLALQRDFFSSRWNIFDLVIVIFSIVDLLLEAILKDTDANLNVIRGMRLLRVFKLAQSWITMKVLLNIIFSTFGQLGNLTLVLLIVIYIFAVLGMELVGSGYTSHAFDVKLPTDDDFPRWHFLSFWYSFMMVFRILCGEWIEGLWDCLKAHSDADKTTGRVKCFFIFLPILIIGNFIVLNLFLALLLNSFNTEELNAQRDKEMEASGKSEGLKKIVGLLLKNKSKDSDSKSQITTLPALTITEAANSNETTSQGEKPGSSSQSISSNAVVIEPQIPPPTYVIEPRIKTPSLHTVTDEEIELSDCESKSMADSERERRGLTRFKKLATKIIIQNRKLVAEKAIEKAEANNKNVKFGFLQNPLSSNRKRSSFGLGEGAEGKPSDPGEEPKNYTPGPCFPPRLIAWDPCNCFDKITALFARWKLYTGVRNISIHIVNHPVFEWLILALIFASSITLCFEDIHLDNNPNLQNILFYMNTAFTAIFVMEMILKILALGVWSYITDLWTLLDMFIVIVSLVSLHFDIEARANPGQAQDSKLASLKALRTLRALRPLRAISRWQGMKIVVNALMFAIPSIFNVLLVCLLFWLVFSIMGVQFFKGKFYKCVNNTNGEMISNKLIANKVECCSNSSLSWVNSYPNFDNVLDGYLSLFQIATFEGWMELMRYAVDSTEIDKQPSRDSHIAYYGFFVVFIVFGSFFTLNLFIGVIIDNFNMLKKKYEGNLLEVLLTPSQRTYYTAMKKLGRKKPRKVIRRPENGFLSLFYDISMSRKFEIAIFVLIFLNMVVMAFEHYDMQPLTIHILSGFNSFFTTIYALESLVKIIGLRHYYFTIPWNVFDFVLVVASILDLMVGDLILNFPIPPTMLRVVRVFRIGRVLRLIKAAKGIRKLLFALIVSLPALFNIGALLALITFIYSILGMSLFGKVAKYGSIDELFNFETFLKSSLMLFRLMTAAGWNDVLDALSQVKGECGTYKKIKCGNDAAGEPECANRGLAVFYMVSYIIVSYLIVINMYIAIILENFVEANREEEIGIVEDDLEMFYVRWSRYDPQATQFINFDQFSEFLASLDPPLGVPKPNIVAIVAFNLPIARGNKIHCLDILHALVKHCLGHVDDSEEFRKIQDQMEDKFRKQFPTRKQLDVISSTRMWKVQHNAAIVLQRAWRSYRARKYPHLEKERGAQTFRSQGVSTGSGTGGIGQMMNRVGNLFHIGALSSQKTSVPRHSIVPQRQSKVSSPQESNPTDLPSPPSAWAPPAAPTAQEVNKIINKEVLQQPGGSSPMITRNQASLEDQEESDTFTTTNTSPNTSASISHQSSPMNRSVDGVIRRHRSPGNRAHRLSPSRLSGGSFDVAMNYGHHLLTILKNKTIGSNNTNNAILNNTDHEHGPASLNGSGNPTTNEKSVVVQIHQYDYPN